MTRDSDGIRRDELRSVGGSWGGLLFENRRTGFPLSLTWTFKFDFAEVARVFGSSVVNLTVDWIPLPGASWDAMAGRRAYCSSFADPIEASAYFFDHHRFNAASVEVSEQDEGRLYVKASASGDLDGLGLDWLAVEGWLEFGGVIVQPETKPNTVDAARALLAQFSSPTGLVGEDLGDNYRFRPARQPALSSGHQVDLSGPPEGASVEPPQSTARQAGSARRSGRAGV